MMSLSLSLSLSLSPSFSLSLSLSLSPSFSLSLPFSCAAEGTTEDYEVNTGRVQIFRAAADVEVTFWPDNVALEDDEQFTMRLIPAGPLSDLPGPGQFLLAEITVTIRDSDGKWANQALVDLLENFVPPQ